MEMTLGSLGNVELYFLLKDYSDKQMKDLVNLLPLTLSGVWVDNWAENKSIEVEFDANLFCQPIETNEEVFFRFQLEDNYVNIYLLPERAVILILFRAWTFLENQLTVLIKHLLTGYELLLSGFELDFDWDAVDLEPAIEKLKANGFNYPFILKRFNDNEPTIFCHNEISHERDLLDLLKAKIHPVLNLIS